MSQTTKRSVLVLLIGISISLVLLSGSLSNTGLHEGAPFPGGSGSNNSIPSRPDLMPGDRYVSPTLQELVNFILLIIVAYVSARLIPVLNIKRIAQLLLATIILLLIVNLISYLPGSRPVNPSAPLPEVTQPPPEYAVAPLGEPSQGLLQLVWIGFLLGVGFLAARLLRRLPSPPTVKDQLSQEAESAVNAIKFGRDLRDVIMRCYLQMTRMLEEERSIERTTCMTVREFEERLESLGFPPLPVHQLSRLFEKVRYGQEAMLEQDEKTAVESLDAILQYCRSQREPSR
jgi:hypothetical protein